MIEGLNMYRKTEVTLKKAGRIINSTGRGETEHFATLLFTYYWPLIPEPLKPSILPVSGHHTSPGHTHFRCCADPKTELCFSLL